MGYPLKKESERKFTWTDYLTWHEDERWEVIDGEAYCMTPAPSIRHQDIVVNLATRLKQKLGGGPCRPFVAPTDVVLSEYDVVQPDILVVCDKKKITDANIQGAPDLIIEVLSPNTSLKDKREKKSLYERFGVREYIIVDPLEQYVERFLFEDDGTYGKGEVFGPQEVLQINSLEGIDISLWEVFEVEGPKEIKERD
ncbi:MAG: Uma2 family endonuclease [Candidatus Brocadiaceae bacterium]|nr:Uma2 family endonuclease [Candidatus Brocadiaceae bacterium]